MFCTFHWNVFIKVQLTISPAWLRDWFSSSRQQVIISTNDGSINGHIGEDGTVYPKKYEHGFVVLCFVVVMQSFLMNSHEVFIHIHQGCFAGTGAIVRQCQWSKPYGYGKISQCITTTKGNTTLCRYNAVNFLPPSPSHKIHPIARPFGPGMECILWIQTLIYTLPQSLKWCIQ